MWYIQSFLVCQFWDIVTKILELTDRNWGFIKVGWDNFKLETLEKIYICSIIIFIMAWKWLFSLLMNIVVLLVFITDYNVKWYHNMKMFYPVLVIQFKDNIGQTWKKNLLLSFKIDRVGTFNVVYCLSTLILIASYIATSILVGVDFYKNKKLLSRTVSRLRTARQSYFSFIGTFIGTDVFW